MNHSQDFTVTLTIEQDRLQRAVAGQASEYQQAQVLVQAAVEALIQSGYSPKDALLKVGQMAAISILSEEEMMDDFWADDSDPDTGSVPDEGNWQ